MIRHQKVANFTDKPAIGDPFCRRLSNRCGGDNVDFGAVGKLDSLDWFNFAATDYGAIGGDGHNVTLQ